MVVIGGGFGGASAARALRAADPRVAVTLMEASRTFTACPFSNLVIGGLRELRQQQFGYNKVAGDGVEVANPFITFHTVAVESGIIEFSWTGDNGYTATERVAITVD